MIIYSPSLKEDIVSAILDEKKSIQFNQEIDLMKAMSAIEFFQQKDSNNDSFLCFEGIINKEYIRLKFIKQEYLSDNKEGICFYIVNSKIFGQYNSKSASSTGHVLPHREEDKPSIFNYSKGKLSDVHYYINGKKDRILQRPISTYFSEKIEFFMFNEKTHPFYLQYIALENNKYDFYFTLSNHTKVLNLDDILIVLPRFSNYNMEDFYNIHETIHLDELQLLSMYYI